MSSSVGGCFGLWVDALVSVVDGCIGRYIGALDRGWVDWYVE